MYLHSLATGATVRKSYRVRVKIHHFGVPRPKKQIIYLHNIILSPVGRGDRNAGTVASRI